MGPAQTWLRVSVPGLLEAGSCSPLLGCLEHISRNMRSRPWEEQVLLHPSQSSLGAGSCPWSHHLARKAGIECHQGGQWPKQRDLPACRHDSAWKLLWARWDEVPGSDPGGLGYQTVARGLPEGNEPEEAGQGSVSGAAWPGLGTFLLSLGTQSQRTIL